MFSRLWNRWFSNPKEPIPDEPPKVTNVTATEVIILSAFHHEKLCYMMDVPRHIADGIGATGDRYYGTRSIPELLPVVKKWLDENAPGYTYKPSRAANFLLDVSFSNRTDAAKFRLFWM
jgi:hypothetical protein